jgi:hypothetical protein
MTRTLCLAAIAALGCAKEEAKPAAMPAPMPVTARPPMPAAAPVPIGDPPRAAKFSVDADAGRNKFDAVFDAPLGERIVATSSQVGCSLSYDAKAGLASGSCSVPLTTITVDNEPIKADHFHQWATNKKSDPAACRFEAKFENVKIDPPINSGGPSKFSAEVPFTICGRARDDGAKERIEGAAMYFPPGAYGASETLRIRARVEKFNRDRYHIGPKYTEGWLARVQSLANVVAEEGTIDLSLFALPEASQ